MKVTLFMAMSVNGYIADTNGREDFLSHDGWEVFVELAERIGVFIVGRKTYDAVKQDYENFGYGDVNADRIMISGQDIKAPEGWHIAHSPAEALALAEQLGHRKALLTGGAIINAAFLSQRLIDEIIFNVEPVVVGQGVPVFGTFNKNAELMFKKMISRPNGVRQLHYSVRA